jgi:excisionase family DNA binding protein
VRRLPTYGSMTRAPLLTTAELALHLRVTRRWIYQQVDSHAMPAYRLGARALRFDLAAVQAWLEAHKIGQWEQPDGTCDAAPSDFQCD